MTTETVNGATKTSMNEANERDPFNNNSYGTIVDGGYKLVNLPLLDVQDFNERIIRGYEEGWGERDLPADLTLARSLVPAGTATLRDFSNIAPEIPLYIPENCTGCMNCDHPSIRFSYNQFPNPILVSEHMSHDSVTLASTCAHGERNPRSFFFEFGQEGIFRVSLYKA